MNIRILPVVSLAAALALQAIPLARAQSPTAPAPSGPFEAFPTLSAAAILRPEFLQGPNFTVRDPVPTYTGANRFTIDSDFGVFEADGNAMLMRRIREIAAIAQLNQMSATEEFGDAVKRAAASPLVAAQELVTNPVGTITGVPKGIWKFMNRAGQSIKEIGEGRKSDPGNSVESMIGFSRTKRELALKLGVDPYSDNEVFQKALNRVAWPAFAGGFTVKLGMAAVSGGAGAALSAANWTNTLNDALREKSPEDLRLMNLGKLLKLGVSREVAVPFLNNTAFSPTNQTILVAALEQIGNIEGVSEYIRMTNRAENETDALFCQQSAQLMAKVNDTAPLVRIIELNGLPVCQTNDGTVIVPLQWDYVVWTPMAARFAAALKTNKFGIPATAYMVVLSGVVSPASATAMGGLKINFSQKQLPGPLQ